MVFEFGTWNVRTLYRPGALMALLMELKRYKVQVAAIQETRWHGTGINDHKSHTILYSGKKEGIHEYGVAFIVDRTIKEKIIDFKPVSERICVLRLRTKFGNISMINAYAPTEEKDPVEKDEFYDRMERVLDSLPNYDTKIILGDLNAKIGIEREYRSITGNNSLHDVSNDNGRRLIDLAESRNMIISSTQFPHKEIHKQTWRSPDGTTVNQIDHILIDKRRASGITDVRSYRGADGDSDHYLVKAKYICKITRTSNRQYTVPPKYNVLALKEQETLVKYRKILDERLQSANEVEQEEVEPRWEELKKIIKATTEEIVGLEPKVPRNCWFDKECERALEERNIARNKYLARPTRAKYTEFQTKRREASYICRRKKREANNKRIVEMEKDFQENNIRQGYREVRYRKKGFIPRIDMIRELNGNIISAQEQVLDRWKSHFQQLLNNKTGDEEILEDFNGDFIEDEMEEPDRIDIRMAIEALKNGKAPGMDNIPAELIKAGGEPMERAIYSLITLIWKRERMPTEWQTAIVCPIYKKGDRLDCHNYRGISLLCTVYKIFTYILRKKLEPYYERVIGEYQAGFRRGTSTTDQIYTVKLMSEKFWEYNMNLYHLFIDFKTAYDSVDRTGLYTILAQQRIHPKIIRLIKMTCLK